MSRRILLSICVVLVVVAAFIEAAPREKRELGGNFGGLQGGRKFDLKTDSQEIKNRRFGGYGGYGYPPLPFGYPGGIFGNPNGGFGGYP